MRVQFALQGAPAQRSPINAAGCDDSTITQQSTFADVGESQHRARLGDKSRWGRRAPGIGPGVGPGEQPGQGSRRWAGRGLVKGRQGCWSPTVGLPAVAPGGGAKGPSQRARKNPRKGGLGGLACDGRLFYLKGANAFFKKAFYVADVTKKPF